MPNWMRETSFKRKHLLVSEYLPEMSRGCTTRKKHNIAPESHEFLFYSSRDNTKLEKYLKIFYVYLQLCTFPGHREATEEPIPAILCDWLQHTPALFSIWIHVFGSGTCTKLLPVPAALPPSLFPNPLSLVLTQNVLCPVFVKKKKKNPLTPPRIPPPR